MTTPTLDAQSTATLIACGITAFSTLGGILITSLFNIRQARLNFRTQTEQKAAELRLAKLEEVYLLFHKWETHLGGNYLTYLRCYRGQLEYAQALEVIKGSSMLLPGEHQKMMMLLNIHFPRLVADHAPVNAARGALVPFYSDPAKSRLRANDFEARQVEFEEACRVFRGLIAQQAKSAETKKTKRQAARAG